MSTERTTPFGQWLKQRRRELDLTQEAVAEATRCSPDTIRKIEAGKRRPSRQIAELLADYLGVGSEERPTFVLWARGMTQPTPTVTSGGEGRSQAQTGVASQGSTSRAGVASLLPMLPTPLLGREGELTRAKTLLWRADTRLLTLVGPPGIGKTSLGIAIASAVEADFKDGVLYVPLGPISGAALVPATLAEALEVRETPSRPLIDSLRDKLRDKQMLLVLDNFEHVVQAAPTINELLAGAPQLKVLVTSRSPLHLRGEKLMEVPPLDMPEAGRDVPVEEAKEIESVALFVERVRDVNDDFKLTQENVGAVVAICERLAGLPLAIELAAARTRLLSLQSLLARLERQLSLLSGGPRDAPLQHRALRDALETSYGLLAEDEQKVFRRLGIFVGPFTLEAAEQVAGADVRRLEAVLNQSLLHRDRRARAERGGQEWEGEGRFAMLIPVREFAVEKMEAGERDELALGHARYFLDLALVAEEELKGLNYKSWLDEIEADYSDIRAALDWCLKNEQAEMALRLGAAIRYFWQSRGYRQEAVRWLEQALEQGKDAPLEARAGALHALGGLLFRSGDLKAAERPAAEAVQLFREAGNKAELIHALVSLGQILGDLGEHERAGSAYREVISLAEEAGNKPMEGTGLAGLGRVASREGNLEQALAYYEGSLAVRRQVGIPTEIAHAMNNVGAMALRLGDYRRAIACAEEGAAISSEIGSVELLSYALGVAGKAALKLGDHERASTNFGKCLEVFVDFGATRMVAFVFEEIGRVAIAQGRYARAARLFGVAEALRESIGSFVVAVDRAERDESIAALQQALSEPEFSAAWTVGRGMRLEEAVAYALSRR